MTLHTAATAPSRMDISAGGAGKWVKGSIKVPGTGGAWKTTEGIEVELQKGAQDGLDVLSRRILAAVD